MKYKITLPRYGVKEYNVHMKAIIVAGGRGERLRPITDNIPKPMVPVLGKPILEHTILLLKHYGIREFIIALCYLPQVVKEYFGDGSSLGVSISYIYEDPNTPLGTAGALYAAKDLIDDTCIVTYADIIRELDVAQMLEQHNRSGYSITINGYINHASSYKSSIILNKEASSVKIFYEIPERKNREKDEIVISNGSLYIIEKNIFSYIKEGTRSDFAHDIFPLLLQQNTPIGVYVSDGYFIDIGNKEKLLQAEKDISENPARLGY
jgi:NDP-sugar pyrophosphorylase family protein